MPSTLYQSVKKSVIEFAELRKKNEKTEDKLIFRWKLITLGLSIVFIILVGGFSQILKAVNSLPDQLNDKSFLLPLLLAVSPLSVPTVQQANLLANGITSSLDNSGNDYAWNRAALLYRGASADLNAIVAAIASRGDLVWVLSDTSLPSTKFAFYAHQAFTESATNVEDESGSRLSTFFNLETQKVLNYDASNCPLYTRNDTHLTLFSAFTIDSAGQATVAIENVANEPCFKPAPASTANKELQQLVGLIALPPAVLTLATLQIFQLYLDQSL